MITCTRRIQFCAGHRVVGHENKCANYHGHNYVVLITAMANELDSVGRVVDFSVLKEKVGGWIDRYWDHTFLAGPKEDNEVLSAMCKVNNKMPFECSFNPTAENMADFLLREICPKLLPAHIRVTHVRVWETENCYADASI